MYGGKVVNRDVARLPGGLVIFNRLDDRLCMVVFIRPGAKAFLASLTDRTGSVFLS